MSKQHWSEYWNMGLLTSLPIDFKENYDGELASFWKEVIEEINDDSAVLDLCTGNGAIAILLKELSIQSGKNIHMTAVDASSIQPVKISTNFPHKKELIDQINFISNCYVEDMNEVLNAGFDLIVSQYGVEYCETEAAAESVFNQLNNKGKFVFVAHSPDTAMLDYMRLEEEVFQLLEDNKVFEIFKKFNVQKISSNGFKIKLKNILNDISQHNLRSHQLLNSWGQNMFQLYQMKNDDLNQQRNNVGLFLQQNLHARARAKDMLNVSSKLQDPNWIDPFKKKGLKLIRDGHIKYQNKHNVGHFYEFYKP